MNRIVVELDDNQAEALAQFCKRSFVDRVRSFSSSKDEAWRMVDAIDQLRLALAEAGWSPR